MDKEVEKYEQTWRAMYDKVGLVRDFLDALPEHEIEDARDRANELLETGPLSPCVVIIPVAAHQEAHNIYHTLSEYARQDTTEPFSVVLYMNSDVSTSRESDIKASFAEYERAKKDFPELDVRMTYQAYFEPTIGEIRRGIWNAVAVAGVEGGTITEEEDILAVNHDIDLVKLPRHFMRVIQERQKDPIRMVSPIHTTVRHAPVANYPNVSRTIAWDEALARVMNPGYEAGTIIPMSFYAQEGGIDPNKTRGEVLSFLGEKASKSRLKAGWTLTSGRRYVEKLHQSADMLDLWASSAFLPTEEYRRESPDIRDISDKEFEAVIKKTVSKRLPTAIIQETIKTRAQVREVLWDDHLSDEQKREAITATLLRQYQFNRNLLDRVMNLSVQSKKFKKNSVASIYPDNELLIIASGLAANNVANYKPVNEERS